MFKSLMIILLICGASLRYSDLDSDSTLYSVLLPLVAVTGLIALAVWLVALLHRRGFGRNTAGDGGGLDFFDGDSGGGD